MAMAYTLAGPMVSSGVSGTELKASARQLAAGLRKARSDAVAHRHDVVVMVDVEGHQFQISSEQRIYHLPKTVAVKLFTAQSELVNGTTGAIRFFPDGGSTGGRITLSAHERNYGVDINWLTGQVAIID
jgi:general secretion pathway protein H